MKYQYLGAHAVHRLRQRLAGDGHLVNADVREIADRLPVQASVGVERERAVAALVSGVGRARRKAASAGGFT